MIVALVVNRVTSDIEKNMSDILRMADEAVEEGVELVLFSEAALTGLINNDDPNHDLPLGQEIPGPITHVLSHHAQSRNIWLGALGDC